MGMSLDQMKVAAYERMVAMQRLQGELNQLNTAIAEATKKQQEDAVKEAKKAEKNVNKDKGKKKEDKG